MGIFEKELIQSFWKENKEEIYKYAIKNFHVEGLYSLMLFRSEKLKIRLYVIKEGVKSLEMTHLHNDTSLSVHNHPFDFQSQTLKGYMENLIYYEGEKSLESGSIAEIPENNNHNWIRYTYEGALSNSDKQMRLSDSKNVKIWGPCIQPVTEGNTYHFASHQLHRIRVPSDQTTIILFWEHEKIPNYPSYIYSSVPLPPVTDYSKFYLPMTPEEVDDLLSFVIQSL